MVLKKLNLLVSLLIAMIVSGCSSLPDKEKEYQLTSEIPPLVLPEDFSDQESQTSSSDNGFPDLAETTENTEEDDWKENTLVNLGKYSDGTPLIRVGGHVQRSWRIVGKALSHHSIEITDRDELERIYFVQYDPDFKKIEDGSLWDEFLFIFGSDPANDKKFGIKLVENGASTEIIILNSDDKPVAEGAGLKLLRLLYKTMKEDLDD